MGRGHVGVNTGSITSSSGHVNECMYAQEAYSLPRELASAGNHRPPHKITLLPVMSLMITTHTHTLTHTHTHTHTHYEQ